MMQLLKWKTYLVSSHISKKKVLKVGMQLYSEDYLWTINNKWPVLKDKFGILHLKPCFKATL